MDRNTIIGFILIGLVLMVWMWLSAPQPSQRPPQSSTPSDTTAHQQSQTRSDSQLMKQSPQVPAPKDSSADSLGKFFSNFAKGSNRRVTISTPLYRADLGTHGGGLLSWELHDFKTWDQRPVDLMQDSKTGGFNLIFYTSDGKLINTGDLFFEVGQNSASGNMTLGEGDSTRVDFVLRINDHARITKSYTFYGDRYSCNVTCTFEGTGQIISNYEYQAIWDAGLPYFEGNSVDESNHSIAMALAGGELTEVDATDFNVTSRQDLSGTITWTGMHNKYFGYAIIPQEDDVAGAVLEGTKVHAANSGAKENYVIGVRMAHRGLAKESDRFTLYLGPLDFDILQGYNVGLDQMVSLGAAWIIRPISEYVILPLFQFLHSFIPNYGIVLIVFAFIVKIALYPLTKSSMRSMQKMQALQPMMEEIREKHKDDPQKMNQQIMRLYREYGVNPAGGCLPMLLQLPILYALWSVFSSTIELRQASFMFWIKDLSIPDVVVVLPFKLPLFGIDYISGLALLMGITMFIQQKMTVKDPRQKMMVWLMPIMLTLLFMSFPSGLNLYYFVFNVLSIAQQAWMNKQHQGEPLRKVDEKKGGGGIFGALSKNMPNIKR